MKRKYARIFSREVPNEGVKYMIDEIREMSAEEAISMNKKSNTTSIWIAIPDGLYEKWIKNLYVGDKTLLTE